MFCFMRISLVLEVNKTGVVYYVHVTNEAKGELNPCDRMDSGEGLLGNPLSTKDTTEVFLFPARSTLPL